MSDPGTAPQVTEAVRRVRATLPVATGRTVLREVRDGDVDAVHAYRSLPEVTRHLGHEPLDRAGAQDLVHRWRTDPAGLSTVIEVEGRVVGDVRLMVRPCSAMSPATTSEVEAWLGYAVHPLFQGRGLAGEAVAAVVAAAFEAAGARRITAKVFSGATGSSKLLARLGFHLDGVDRRAVLSPDGQQWWDDECWSLLRDD